MDCKHPVPIINIFLCFRPRKQKEPKGPKPKKQKAEVLSAKQKKKIVSKQFISSSENDSSSDEEGLKIDVANVLVEQFHLFFFALQLK